LFSLINLAPTAFLHIDIKVENGLRKVPEVVQVDDPCDTGSQEEE
jgi:hypothetical protein